MEELLVAYKSFWDGSLLSYSCLLLKWATKSITCQVHSGRLTGVLEKQVWCNSEKMDLNAFTYVAAVESCAPSADENEIGSIFSCNADYAPVNPSWWWHANTTDALLPPTVAVQKLSSRGNLLEVQLPDSCILQAWKCFPWWFIKRCANRRQDITGSSGTLLLLAQNRALWAEEATRCPIKILFHVVISVCHDLCRALFSASLQLSTLFPGFHAGIPWEHVVTVCCIAVFCLGASNVEDVLC